MIEKKEYAAPTVTVLGDVRVVTRGGGNPPNKDNAANQPGKTTADKKT